MKRVVLVAHSDPSLSRRIKRELESDDELIVKMVRGGYEALWAIVDRAPDLLVLDAELPDLTETEVCRILRSRQGTAGVPVLILASKAVGAAEAASAGADDYLAKPFAIKELQARIRFALRRRTQARGARLNSYRGAHLQANFGDGFVAIGRRRIDLARREFDLLWYLVEHRNEVVSSERLVEVVWSDTSVAADSGTVATHVARLRAKLGKAGKQIRTFIRKGYMFIEDADVPSGDV